MLVWAQSVKQLCSKSMEPIIEEFDLTMIEIGIILFLAESPACDTCRDIADNLLLAKSNVSTAVEHLVQKGLVGRKPDQADRRPSARALVRKGQSARDTLLQELMSGFTPEEIGQMEHLEQKLLEQIRLVLKKL